MSSSRTSPVSKVASSWVGKTKQTCQQRWFSKLKAGLFLFLKFTSAV
jgi:hypothetical protein